jgi:integrase
MFGADYRTDLDLIFCDPQGNYRKPDSVSWAVCDVARRAGLQGVGLHALRHTHASVLLHAGVPVTNVSKRLGHRDAYTTAKIYAHALPDTDQDVAATWDKIMAPKAAPELQAQRGTMEPGETATRQ